MIRHVLLCAVLCVLLAGSALTAWAVTASPRDAHGFAIAAKPYVFRFPRDHGAHNAYQSEWWYYTGHLKAAGGRRFGYELTFFRVGLRPGSRTRARGESDWRGTQFFPAHFAITDEGGNRFMYSEQYAREALGAGFSSEKTLDLRNNAWWLRNTNPMHLHAQNNRNAIDVLALPLKPPAVHGSNGISRKGACRSCASHYYSITRLRTSGTLTVAGEKLRVCGTSWMDHEFGSDELQDNQAGWDWFSIQLDDGRDVMFYRLREKSGAVSPASSGSLIDQRGRVQHLPRRTVIVVSTATWTSPHTGGVYPAGWILSVPNAAIDVVLRPVIVDQELVNEKGISYWEGAAEVRDRRSGRHVGDAYVELTGYAGALSL
ncbi:MAG: carotenoid 1,2-hydratase [Candidatus Eremiobacteraeota bacterium]|nr:carotenoid 1,2-hydratase [Candidatus Eremiobacteraeota bacterium]